MATDTLSQTETDIASLVDEIFDQLDCCSVRKHQIPCGGEIRGFQEFHDCVQGPLCAVHWENAIHLFAHFKKAFEKNGSIRCAHCLNSFTDIREYMRLIPL